MLKQFVCLFHFFHHCEIMQTLIRVPLKPLSETLVNLSGLRGGAAGYSGRGCAHARCSPLWKSLVLSQTVWVDLVHQWRGDIGHRSFVLYISSAFASSVRLLISRGLQNCPKPSHFPSQTDRCIHYYSDNGSSKGIEHNEDVWLSGQEEYSPHNRELWNIFFNY